MRLEKILLLFGSLSVCFCVCQHQATTSVPVVPPPRFVASTADTSANEYGIDAVPEADAIFLQWHKDALYESFEVFRRMQDERDFKMIVHLNKMDSSYLDMVTINKRYFYYLRASDEDGHWSEPSDTVNYLLLAKASGLNVVFSTTPEFSWQTQGINPPYYVLRLHDDATDELIWLSHFPSAYQGGEERKSYNWDGKAKINRPLSGRRYRWRVDCLANTPHSGSESNWHRFVMP